MIDSTSVDEQFFKEINKVQEKIDQINDDQNVNSFKKMSSQILLDSILLRYKMEKDREERS